MNAIPSATDNRFSVVLPCYNEADNIVTLVGEIVSCMEENHTLVKSFEVIVVDDCSSDDTIDSLRKRYAADTSGVRIIRHLNNRGQSAAICTGVAAANYPWIATLDGDGQNDPADIPKLIARLKDCADQPGQPMICGQRVKRQDTWLRKVSSKVANSVRAKLLGDATPDTGCGLKLFSKTAFEHFPQFDHMHRFLPALAKRDGGYVESVAVNHRPRVHGVSKYGLHNRLWVGLVDLLGVMWLQRRKFRERDSEER
ncbi:MAG: glycosyltransferase family 2 protein [Gammaproteobacteria bacterium]